jgi:hypothetical protein
VPCSRNRLVSLAASAGFSQNASMLPTPRVFGPFIERNRDFSPFETIAGGLDYFRLADKPGVIAWVARYQGKWFNSE